MMELHSGEPLGDISPVKVTEPDQKPVERETDTVYVELDCLLDTRLGTLYLHDEELAVKILNSKLYPKRVLDRFGKHTVKDFLGWYAKRNIETLQHSLLTNVTFLLQRMIKDCVIHESATNVKQHLHLVINTHPYEFEDTVLLETLKACVDYHMLGAVEITIKNIPHDKLTPKFVKKNFDIMVMYHYQDWLYMHREEFRDTRCVNTTLIAPAMYYESMPDQESLDMCRRAGRDPVQIAEEQMAEFIRLKLMDVSLFCISETINKENAKNISLGLQLQPEDIISAAEEKGMKVVNEEVEPLSSFSPFMDKNGDQML